MESLSFYKIPTVLHTEMERGKRIVILLTAGIIIAILLAAGIFLLLAGIGLYQVRFFQLEAEQNWG